MPKQPEVREPAPKAVPDKIESFFDMIKVIEDDITEIKNGTISCPNANLIYKNRALQTKVVTLVIQYLINPRGKSLATSFAAGLLGAGESEEVSKKPN